ncbi:MAG: hypothetical protein ACYC3X_10915 [Pirellulaceae bacterium]
MTNPYRSPEGVTCGEGGHVGGLLPGARATLVGRGLLYRRLVVEAPLEMTLEFNGRSLTDKVLVNNRIVACQTSWWRITPRLPFTLPAGDDVVTGLVEIHVWPWLALRGFRVTVADRVIYAEGHLV